MNEIYVKIEGLNLARIAEKLISKGVMISNLKIKKTYILFSINQRYRAKLDKICKQEHKKYYIVKNTAIKRFFAKIPYLIGTFIPFCILFAVFYVFSNTIFEINLMVETSENFDLSNVKQILLNNNLMVGQSKKDFSPKEIEKIILENTKDVAGCEVFYDGQKLNITIFPMTEKIEISKDDLLSKYNAVVTKIEAFVGEENVKVGDVVKVGEILIKNNNGVQGEVKGKVYFSSTFIYNEEQEVFVETGNVISQKVYNIASFFDINSTSPVAFKNYKTEIIEQRVVKNLFLPIIEKKYIYKEVEIKEKLVLFEEVEEKIKNDLKEEVLKKLPVGATYENITYSIVKENNYVRVDCFVETEIDLI